MLLDRRIAGLDQEIGQCQKQAEAEEQYRAAREAFRSAEYGDCTARCDELLSGYSPLLDPEVLKEVESLKEQARFRDDDARSFSPPEAAGTLSKRAEMLNGFLARYTDRSLLGEAELRVLKQREDELRQVQRQLAAEERMRDAQREIQQLKERLPRRFDDRLRGAVRIAGRYPDEDVKHQLRASVHQWLQEFLPEKQVAEPPGLREAETTQHEIVRGFFKEVIAPDGTLFGYKRYPTAEALKNPMFDVGTYRKEAFLVRPGPSVPRQCAARYNEARNRLLADPGRRDVWAELAALCESLEGKLADYRQKRGAAEEDRDLSFENEGRLARELSTGSGWADVETLFAP